MDLLPKSVTKFSKLNHNITAGMSKDALELALYVGSWSGQLPVVNALLSANADLNYSPAGTALHASCQHGYIDIVKVLIGAQANRICGMANASSLFLFLPFFTSPFSPSPLYGP